jgi:CheY-like chemotaxis protein
MKRKLKKILLIDDDDATNYVNGKIIGIAGCTEEVVAIESAEAALVYLRTVGDGGPVRPDIIFLDINMPGMNGWEFLDEYDLLPEAQKGKVILVMLTTSVSPEDKRKAKEKGIINGFKTKPLTVDKVNDLIKEYFPDML